MYQRDPRAVSRQDAGINRQADEAPGAVLGRLEDKWGRGARSEWWVEFLQRYNSELTLVVMACQTVSNILKSSLGPVGSAKGNTRRAQS